MKDSHQHNCRVCGLYIIDPPWGEDGQSPTYEICSCCGVEFGHEDYTIESTIQYRKKWLSNNLKWFDDRQRPSNWDFEKQMKDIPIEYRGFPKI